jgi:hypothetical protein
VRPLAFLLALLAALTACSEDFFDPTPGRGAEAPGVELLGKNIRLMPGEAAAFRVSFRPKDPSARVRIERSSPAGRVLACPMRTIDDPIPPSESCLPDLADGVRTNLTAAGLGAVALVREGDPITIDLLLDYEEGGRAFEVRMPVVPVPPGASVCKDNACNPFFEVDPVRGGNFTATARWESGDGKLELLEGRVKARAFSSTGIPYRIAGTQTGPSPLSIQARLNAPSEYALTLVNAGIVELKEIRITATWP